MPEELEATWRGIREELRAEVPDLAFHTWLGPLELAWQEGTALYVRAPGHVRTLVEERYAPVLRRAASRSLGSNAAIELVDERWVAPITSGGADDRGCGDAPGAHLFNPRYTFDQFVIGAGNRLAHAAALAVAEMPGQAYNPLFLHGEPGLGKTHLLHAIGNYVHDYGGGMTVRYATVEAFTNEFVAALRSGKADDFKDRFRGADVLLIDDVQFLARKSKTREEFFHTFNALHETGSQLVITSDRPPAELQELEARLRERFACGLVAAVEPPELDVRLAILRKRVAVDSLVAVGDDTLTEVARHVTTSVRALEGALIRVVAYASLSAAPATPEVARHVLERLYPDRGAERCTLGEIQEAAAAAFGLTRHSLLAKDRHAKVVLARQVAMYLSRELTEESLPAIGAGFGGRNHSTVLHAHGKIARSLAHDQSMRRAVDGLREKLEQRA